MSTYGDLKKAWAREWTRLRREYLDGKVLDAVVLPSRTGVRGGVPMFPVKRRGAGVMAVALGWGPGRAPGS